MGLEATFCQCLHRLPIAGCIAKLLPRSNSCKESGHGVVKKDGKCITKYILRSYIHKKNNFAMAAIVFKAVKLLGL